MYIKRRTFLDEFEMNVTLAVLKHHRQEKTKFKRERFGVKIV